MKTNRCALLCSFLLLASAAVFGQPNERHPHGLNPQATAELADAGVNKYVGEFTPAASFPVGEEWVKHTFDPDGGNGPICIAGTAFSVFTKARNPANVLIMLQGGGACWQDFYNCNILS